LIRKDWLRRKCTKDSFTDDAISLLFKRYQKILVKVIKKKKEINSKEGKKNVL